MKTVKESGKTRPACPECGFIFYHNPTPAAVTVTEDENGNILFIKRGREPAMGKWALPGGFIEAYEDPAAAALRELIEETGITGDSPELIGAYHQKDPLYESVLVLAYKTGIKGTAAPECGDDAVDAKFFSPDKMPSPPFNSHRKALTDFMKLKEKEN
ncbi:MAG: NUDIX hydrolase [Fibrobacterota bacterium]